MAASDHDLPTDGRKVCSLMRSSELATNDYLDRFFETGQERQREIE